MSVQRRAVAGFAVLAATLPLLPLAAHAAPAGEETISAALEAMRQAMLSADKAALEALFLPEGTYGHSDGRLQTKDEFIADTVGKKTEWKAITLSDHRITVSGDTAVARTLFVGEAEQHGKTVTPKITVMIAYRKVGGWKILSRQGYVTT
jgi:ketosteroid isomerase-like protein